MGRTFSQEKRKTEALKGTFLAIVWNISCRLQNDLLFSCLKYQRSRLRSANRFQTEQRQRRMLATTQKPPMTSKHLSQGCTRCRKRTLQQNNNNKSLFIVAIKKHIKQSLPAK